MINNMDLILSMKKEYFDLIKSGKKKYEYRFKMPELNINDKLYLYIAKSKAGIYGYIKIKDVKWMSKDEACTFYSNQLKDKKAAYQIMKEWISHRGGCFVLTISEFKEFENYIPYKELKDNYNFNAPQNYNYVKNEYENFLKN
ncbi:ASCH domain-containing protein [Mesoplasma grammopterae]|nr:ASCH domain-containing protein [Mesoplasma grammopterae]